MLSEDEKYFAFVEHNGAIELVWWTKTEEEARAEVAKWGKEAKVRHDNDPDVHYYVGQILF